MNFIPTPIPGVLIVEAAALRDERGHFSRIFCAEEFARAGLEMTNVQVAVSHNHSRFTLRGLHYIPEEEGEAKLVRCAAGAIFDKSNRQRR